MIFFVHNIDLIALSREILRPQNSHDDIVLADERDYVWDVVWSHPLLIKITTDVSSQAITTISISKDFVRKTPFTFDAIHLNYNAMFADRTA